MVLERGFADPPLTVEEEAVVVNRLQDAFDELLPAKEHFGVEYRRAGDVGVETALHELAAPAHAVRPHPREDHYRDQGNGELKPECAIERNGVDDGVLEGVGVVLGVLDGVELGVLDGVELGVELGVLDGVGVVDGVLLGVLDGVELGVLDGVELGVLDGVLDGSPPTDAMIIGSCANRANGSM